MAHVQYVGNFDRRELSAADWKSLGVEDASKTSFERNELYEVDDNVLEILKGLGDFKEVSPEKAEKLLENTEGNDDDEVDAGQGDSVQTGDAVTTKSTRGGKRGSTSTSTT